MQENILLLLLCVPAACSFFTDYYSSPPPCFSLLSYKITCFFCIDFNASQKLIACLKFLCWQFITHPSTPLLACLFPRTSIELVTVFENICISVKLAIKKFLKLCHCVQGVLFWYFSISPFNSYIRSLKLLPFQIKPKVGTVCFGVAASQGALLLAGGEKGMRYSMPNSRIMIHQPQSGCGVRTGCFIEKKNIFSLVKNLVVLLKKNYIFSCKEYILCLV